VGCVAALANIEIEPSSLKIDDLDRHIRVAFGEHSFGVAMGHSLPD
jgi:hypothetical protein